LQPKRHLSGVSAVQSAYCKQFFRYGGLCHKDNIDIHSAGRKKAQLFPIFSLQLAISAARNDLQRRMAATVM
jgi:hypothetical protein